LDNEVAKNYLPQKSLTSTEDAIKEKLFYSNSENSIDWVIENMPESDLAQMIKISKDKALFREKLKPIYPEYFFKEVEVNELKDLDTKSLKFPFVLKPTVGFLSFGVYPIKNEDEFKKVVLKIEDDLELKTNFNYKAAFCCVNLGDEQKAVQYLNKTINMLNEYGRLPKDIEAIYQKCSFEKDRIMRQGDIEDKEFKQTRFLPAKYAIIALAVILILYVILKMNGY
jgi:hypothetical protein